VAEIRGTSWDDFDAVVELLDTRSRAALGVSDVDADQVRRRWQAPGLDLAADGWAAFDDGRLVGHALLSSTQELGLAARSADVGLALLGRAETRACERGFGLVSVTTAPQDEPVDAAVRQAGFELDREILRMWRPLDDGMAPAEWPPGLIVRTYRPDDGERVHAMLDEAYAGWHADYVGLGHEAWLDFMTVDADFDPDLWFLAERDGETVACALTWRAQQRRGWVKDIAVLQSERGAGLGRALLQHAFQAYEARGATHVGLKVDAANPTGALQLYERTGFVTDQRYGIWLKRL
jgi:mycothiol synthase